MWVDFAAAAGGLLTAVVMIVSGVVVSIRWVIRREIQPVIERLETHEGTQHPRERTQVASAMKREGLSPPDGWNGVAMSSAQHRQG